MEKARYRVEIQVHAGDSWTELEYTFADETDAVLYGRSRKEDFDRVRVLDSETGEPVSIN